MHCPLLSLPLGIKEKGGGEGEKERGFVKMWLIFQILDLGAGEAKNWEGGWWLDFFCKYYVGPWCWAIVQNGWNYI